MDFADCISDKSFGPSVNGCRNGFDFTLKFELLFFATVPSAIFLILAVPRITSLYLQPIIAVWRSWLYASKQVSIPPMLVLILPILSPHILVVAHCDFRLYASPISSFK